MVSINTNHKVLTIVLQKYCIYAASALSFLLLQVQLYGFTVSNRFACPGGENGGEDMDNPCPPQGVVCWVSRAMEKTIFLRFMFIMTIVSIVLTIIELYQLFYKKVYKCGVATVKKLGCSHEEEMTSSDSNTSKYINSFDDCNDEPEKTFSHFI